MFIDTSRFNLLERSLDTASLRQKVISNNIANEETPYFKRSSVSFEDLLQQQLDSGEPVLQGLRTNEKHIAIGGTKQLPTAEVVVDENTSFNNNLNNVDIDYENAQLAQNQLRYNALIQQMNSEFKQLRIAIDGR